MGAGPDAVLSVDGGRVGSGVGVGADSGMDGGTSGWEDMTDGGSLVKWSGGVGA